VLGMDYCGAFTTEHNRRGDVHWPATKMGSRRIVRCPFAFSHSLYAHKDCIPSYGNGTPIWNHANVTTCPISPFSKGADRLASFAVRNFIVSYSLQSSRIFWSLNMFRPPNVAVYYTYIM